MCDARENQAAPWLLFEAGALAKSFKEHSRVCIYLLGMKPVDLSPGPLTLYQAAQAEHEEDTWKLISSLNDIAESERLDKERLRRAFDRSWKEFSARLAKIRTAEVEDLARRRSDRDILEEALAGIRDLQRAVLKANPRPAVSLQYVAPRNKEEEQLVEIIRSVLGYDRIGVFDNFFDLGGDSLNAVQVVSRIREQMKIDVAVGNLFEYPSVQAMAKLLQRRRESDGT
jgi:acyl carrier protein